MRSERYRGERWATVPGFEGRYEVSDQGRLRALFVSRRHPAASVPRVLKPAPDQDGYLLVHLQRAEGGYRQAKLHRLVLEAFIGACPRGQECRHLNGRPADNRLENLAWGTQRRNHRDKVRHGTSPRGTRNVKAKLAEDDVRQIRALAVSGVARNDLKRMFDVSRSTIDHVVARVTWAWLEDSQPPSDCLPSSPVPPSKETP